MYILQSLFTIVQYKKNLLKLKWFPIDSKLESVVVETNKERVKMGIGPLFYETK